MSLTQLHTVLARPIAHRGLHDRAAGRVENSLEAADAALAAGYGIECDVRLTRDGEAVVFHDETLDRLTSASGRVDAWNSAALAELVLRDGGAIPTLARFLDRVDGRVPLVVEIKSDGDGAAALVSRVTALVAGYGGAIALKSFDATIVALCREFKATCPLGLVGPGLRWRSPHAAHLAGLLVVERRAARPASGPRTGDAADGLDRPIARGRRAGRAMSRADCL